MVSKWYRRLIVLLVRHSIILSLPIGLLLSAFLSFPIAPFGGHMAKNFSTYSNILVMSEFKKRDLFCFVCDFRTCMLLLVYDTLCR